MPTPMASTTRYVTIVAHTPSGVAARSCGGDKVRIECRSHAYLLGATVRSDG